MFWILHIQQLVSKQPYTPSIPKQLKMQLAKDTSCMQSLVSFHHRDQKF